MEFNMRFFKFVLFFMPLLFLIACDSSTEPTQEEELISMLEQSQMTVDSAISNVFADAEKAGVAILASNFNETTTRAELSGILSKYTTVLDVVYVNDKGIIKYVEPATYKSSEGGDLSSQVHIQLMMNSKQNVMSNLFKLVENINGVVIAAPIICNGKFMGSVNVVIQPDKFIGYYINKYVAGKVDDFWVMETNSTEIFDTDSTQIGRNILTDPLYAQFTSLHEAVKTINNGASGKTFYSFLDKTKNKTVTKDVWWRTSIYYNTTWKFQIVKERD